MSSSLLLLRCATLLAVALALTACGDDGDAANPPLPAENNDASNTEHNNGDNGGEHNNDDNSDNHDDNSDNHDDNSDDDRPIIPDGPLYTIDVTVNDLDWSMLHTDPGARLEVPCVVEIEGRRFEGAELELHGGFARTVPKKSYRVKFDEDEAPAVDWFGEGPVYTRRIVLHGSFIDATFLRNKLTMDLVRAHGGLAPRLSHAVFSVNGEYHGLYLVSERIDDEYLERQGFDRGGNMYKAENHNANWANKADPLEGFDKKSNEDGPSDDLAELLETIHSTPANHEAFEREVAPLIRIEDVLIFNMVHTFAMNQDTFTKNYYLYHDPEAPIGYPGSTFRLISWDADATFANNWDGAVLDADEEKWRGHDAFSPRLLQIPRYREDYLMDYLDALERGELRVEALHERIDALRERLEDAIERDAARWEREVDVEAEFERLKEAVEARHEVMREVVEDELE